jgi:hypothetical protein
VDGLALYVTVIQDVFRSGLPSGGRGRPHLVPWADIHIGQVVKQYQGHRLVGVVRRMAQGSETVAKQLLVQSRGGSQLNTAYIERLNATFRSRLASLARRSRALLQKPNTLRPLVYLLGSVYNFCCDHQSLRVKLWVGERGYHWVERTPAMATGLTDHCWSVKELLSYRVPPPAWKPTHRGRPTKAEKALVERFAS